MIALRPVDGRRPIIAPFGPHPAPGAAKKGQIETLLCWWLNPGDGRALAPRSGSRRTGIAPARSGID
jgi:hypothetical protein